MPRPQHKLSITIPIYRLYFHKNGLTEFQVLSGADHGPWVTLHAEPYPHLMERWIAAHRSEIAATITRVYE